MDFVFHDHQPKDMRFVLLVLAGLPVLHCFPGSKSLRNVGLRSDYYAGRRASSTQLLVNAQLLLVDESSGKDTEVPTLEFDQLPVPLDRVLLSEQGGAEGCGLSVAAEEDACALLAAAGLDDGEQLSLTLCDDPYIQQLNSEWRSVDEPTDVLSFPMDDDQLLGDLVISIDTARRQASERAHELRDELRILMVHGVLHLLGYDHEDGDVEHREMAEAERTLLTRLGWTGRGLIDASADAEQA
jgi:rRNA maturation RNase YbeY